MANNTDFQKLLDQSVVSASLIFAAKPNFPLEIALAILTVRLYYIIQKSPTISIAAAIIYVVVVLAVTLKLLRDGEMELKQALQRANELIEQDAERAKSSRKLFWRYHSRLSERNNNVARTVYLMTMADTAMERHGRDFERLHYHQRRAAALNRTLRGFTRARFFRDLLTWYAQLAKDFGLWPLALRSPGTGNNVYDYRDAKVPTEVDGSEKS